MTDLQDFPEVADFASLKQQHARWEDMLLEIMYSEFASDETVVESAREVFCKFQPMLAHAADAAKKAAEEEGSTGFDIPTYLESLRSKVTSEVAKKVGRSKNGAAAGRAADSKEAKEAKPTGIKKKGARKEGPGACYAFQKGECKHGDRCRFQHVPAPLQAHSAVVTAPQRDPGNAVLTAQGVQTQQEVNSLREDVQALTGVMKDMLAAAGAGSEKGLAYRAHVKHTGW